jgi:hypothetical protein
VERQACRRSRRGPTGRRGNLSPCQERFDCRFQESLTGNGVLAAVHQDKLYETAEGGTGTPGRS